MLSLNNIQYNSTLHFAECCYAECHYAECRYAQCHNGECRYAECHNGECRCAECRGAFQNDSRVNRNKATPPMPGINDFGLNCDIFISFLRFFKEIV